MKIFPRRCVTVCVGLLYFATQAPAHEVARTESKVEVHRREVTAALVLNLTELKDPVIDLGPTGRITIEQLDGVIGRIFDSAKRHYLVRAPGEPVDIRQGKYLLIDGHVVRLEMQFTFPADITSIEVESSFHRVMPAGHQHLISVILNGALHEGILDARSPKASFTGAAASRRQTLWKFTVLGMEHIFTGYDHLAFLLALLVVTATMGSLVRVVTSFTVAHSITLALATFNVVVLPTRLTESVIALSILYVAVENLLDFRMMKRYYVTFLFGLVHGFGFSNVLRDMELPRASLALSLFSFNLGVEIGQITFVLLVFPFVQDLVKSGWKRLQPTVSAGIGLMAVYWFIQRAFFGF